MKKRKSNLTLIPTVIALVGVVLVSSLFVSLILVQFEEPVSKERVLAGFDDSTCYFDPCASPGASSDCADEPIVVPCIAGNCSIGPCIHYSCTLPNIVCPVTGKTFPGCNEFGEPITHTYGKTLCMYIPTPVCGNSWCEVGEDLESCPYFECRDSKGAVIPNCNCPTLCPRDCPVTPTPTQAVVPSAGSSSGGAPAPAALGGPDTNIGATPTPEPLASFFKSVFPTSSGAASRQCLVNYCVLGPGQLIPNCNVPVGPGPCGHPGCVEGACEVNNTIDILDSSDENETADTSEDSDVLPNGQAVAGTSFGATITALLQDIVDTLNRLLGRFNKS